MSSSNLVQVSVIEEVDLGVTPLTGNFETVRFTSESLSGSPQTTESQQIRSDRLSSGTVVVGLEVGGDFNFELAKEPVIDKFIASAMLSAWDVQPIRNVDLTIVAADNSISRAAGDFNSDLEVGDISSLTGFINEYNNTQFQVLEILDPLTIRVNFAAPIQPIVDEVGTGTHYKRADKIGIGTTKKSFSLEKGFLDLADKGFVYKGMLVDKMDLNIKYGEIVTGSFGLVGTNYAVAETASDFITHLRTILPPATSNSLNGSIDMPFISSSILGDMYPVDFCIQNLSIGLNNNFSAQNCIGSIAPKNHTPGAAAIDVKLSAYLSDANFSVVAKKLSQAPFALGAMVKNADGFYGFYLPAVQITMDDPSSGGANQDISVEMSGTAKVGAAGEKSLYIYRS